MQATTNSHLKRPLAKQKITSVKVTNAVERLSCLPEIAGLDCVVLEHTIYDMMRVLSDDYDGGCWEYYRLSNTGFYMVPKTVKPYDTAGLIACAMAYSHLSFRERGERFREAYELLTGFIFQYQDVRLIRTVLD